MHTKFVEATQGVDDGFNHGKFMVGIFTDDEWRHRCELDAHQGYERSLLQRCGWTKESKQHQHILVTDLQTGEGALFRPGGLASADLGKHKLWVCPMFEPFLEWLYGHIAEPNSIDGTPTPMLPWWFMMLPKLVEIPDAPGAMYGYRREGPEADADVA